MMRPEDQELLESIFDKINIHDCTTGRVPTVLLVDESTHFRLKNFTEYTAKAKGVSFAGLMVAVYAGNNDEKIEVY